MKLYSKEYGSGFPLIILHGLLGSSGNWHTLSRNVFSEEFNVFTVDLRNHGQSPHNEEMTYEVMAADVLSFAAERELQRFHVLGHSMGGKVAMELAAAPESPVEKLIVADIAPRKYPDQHTYIFEALTGLDLNAISSRKEADETLSESIASFPVRQFLLKNLAFDRGNGYYWRPNLEYIWRAYAKISDSSIGFEDRVLQDTLFVRGGSSGYITAEDELQIERQFLHSRIETIDNVGHWLHAEAPEQFSKIVLQFLSE